MSEPRILKNGGGVEALNVVLGHPAGPVPTRSSVPMSLLYGGNSGAGFDLRGTVASTESIKQYFASKVGSGCAPTGFFRELGTYLIGLGQSLADSHFGDEDTTGSAVGYSLKNAS